jgi:hypothetical protein
VLTGTIGARRACTVSIISPLPMPCRYTDVIPEVAVAELAPDDDQRYAFACHFDGVGVPELVWREAAARRPPRRCAAIRLAPRRATSGVRV